MKRSFFFLPWFAQTLTNAPAASPAAGESNGVTQQELMQSFLHLQEQLHEAKLAIEANKTESQRSAESASKQATEITQKLADIKLAIDDNRKQQQDELNRSNRALLWVAVVFGLAGMGAMAFTAFFQWRTVNQIASLAPIRAQLPAGASAGLLGAGDIAGGTVELSNQRLMSVIERLERRVLELERPISATEPGVDSANGGGEGSVDSAEPNATIARLLGKGQSFLEEDQPEQALDCFNEILELDEDHPEALVKKGASLERLRRDEQALQCYDRAIKADDKMTIAYLYKGGIFNRLERYNEALECYEQALRAQGAQER
jgi:tetratricopeptide (TPR) repeat protein